MNHFKVLSILSTLLAMRILDIVSAISEITKNFFKNTKIILFSQKYKNIHLYVFQIYDLRNSLYLELKSVVQNARSVSLTVQPRDPTPFQYDAKNIYIFIFHILNSREIYYYHLITFIRDRNLRLWKLYVSCHTIKFSQIHSSFPML